MEKTMNGADIISNVVTERLKEHITHELNGTNIMLVIQKELIPSDLEPNRNSLNMPIKQLQTHDFLTPDERARLVDGSHDFLTPDEKARLDVGSRDFYVLLLGPKLQMYEQMPIKLEQWNLKTISIIVLTTGWKNFVHENENDLKLGATIQVWSFRMEDQNKLCLAIAVVKRAD